MDEKRLRLDELVGRSCQMEFTLPAAEWPIPGWPAWVIIDEVAMPMIKIRSKFAGDPMWVNASIIQRIWGVEDNRAVHQPIKAADIWP